jgi:hypothetical protein
VTSGASPVMRARFSHAVGVSPFGGAPGVTDAHAASSHATRGTPSSRFKAS